MNYFYDLPDDIIEKITSYNITQNNIHEHGYRITQMETRFNPDWNAS